MQSEGLVQAAQEYAGEETHLDANAELHPVLSNVLQGLQKLSSQ